MILIFVKIKMFILSIRLFSLVGVTYFRKQLLIILIRLEFVVLSLFITLVVTQNQLSQPISISFFILILGACETRIALRLLVMITRFKGTDILRNIRTYKY